MAAPTNAGFFAMLIRNSSFRSRSLRGVMIFQRVRSPAIRRLCLDWRARGPLGSEEIAGMVQAGARSEIVKQRDRSMNWLECDQTLGRLTVWFDQASISDGWEHMGPKGQGNPGLFSDPAIQTSLTVTTLFRLPYRATGRVIGSLMKLSGVDLPVPDHAHLLLPAASLTVKIPLGPRNGLMHVVVDFTGLKIFGEGEWREARRHGAGKRFTSRKIHLAVDEAVRAIIGIQVTAADWGDGSILPQVLEQIEGDFGRMSADGAYDTKDCHAAISRQGTLATIPHKKGAVPFGRGSPARRDP
jgi:hypothetical protein